MPSLLKNMLYHVCVMMNQYIYQCRSMYLFSIFCNEGQLPSLQSLRTFSSILQSNRMSVCLFEAHLFRNGWTDFAISFSYLFCQVVVF